MELLPGAPLGLSGSALKPSDVRQLPWLLVGLPFVGFALLAGGTTVFWSTCLVSGTVGRVLQEGGETAILPVWAHAGRPPNKAAAATMIRVGFMMAYRVWVFAPPFAVALLVLEPETDAPPVPAPTPTPVLVPTPAPAPAPLLTPAAGVLVVAPAPVPIPVLPPTLPPVVTPVDWACAAAAARISAAARVMVLVMGILRGSGESTLGRGGRFRPAGYN